MTERPDWPTLEDWLASGLPRHLPPRGGVMTHDPLCPQGNGDGIITTAGVGDFPCLCDLIAKVRADERSRKGTCWREATEGAEIPPGAIRVYREAGWFWEIE